MFLLTTKRLPASYLASLCAPPLAVCLEQKPSELLAAEANGNGSIHDGDVVYAVASPEYSTLPFGAQPLPGSFFATNSDEARYDRYSSDSSTSDACAGSDASTTLIAPDGSVDPVLHFGHAQQQQQVRKDRSIDPVSVRG